ncbi:MAG: TolC family outer membrane protein [Gammaproteobacteria bacterium]|nr:TolC family outer membrane protein [Gammaproteobacteria bacterium]
MYRQTILLLTIVGCNHAATAADLLDIYSMAETSDPSFQEARANFEATLETKPQARAQLLPQLNLSLHQESNTQDIKTTGPSSTVDFTSRGFNLDLRQPIFRAPAYLQYQQSDSIINQAEAELQAARQDLAIRVAEAYFDVLAAEDNLTFARAEKRSLEQQLEQAEQRFEVGLTAITDIQEARAGYDRATAQVIEAENAVDNARETLREITGEYVTNVARLSEEVPLVKPNPDDIDAWTSRSLEQNLAVIAAQHGLETADQEIDIQKAEHLPTLDLVAGRNYESSGGFFGSRQIRTDAVGVELNMPLFQGGAVTSRTREARKQYDATLQRLHLRQRSAQSQTRQSYLGVISGISRIKALEQAVVSSETALEATNAGFDVGTRTAVDVVAAERALSDARRNLARARYDYIVDSLRLKQAAGILGNQDLALVNRWLQ